MSVDGEPMPLILYETSEQLEYEPATLKVIVHKRAVYACPAEHAMKPVAIGRMNWLFVCSPAAGRRAAVLMSQIASCKTNHLEPWAWLQNTLTELPRGVSLESLLPDNWLKTHPQHRWTIADRRKQERTAKGNWSSSRAYLRS